MSTSSEILAELEKIKAKSTLTREVLERVEELRHEGGLITGEGGIAAKIMAMADSIMKASSAENFGNKDNSIKGDMRGSEQSEKLDMDQVASKAETYGLNAVREALSTKPVFAARSDVDTSSAKTKLNRVRNDEQIGKAQSRLEEMQNKDESAIKKETKNIRVKEDVEEDDETDINPKKKKKQDTDDKPVTEAKDSKAHDDDGDDDAPPKDKKKKDDDDDDDDMQEAVSSTKRKNATKSGAAEPDGSFPIENEKDLDNAINDYGRAGAKSSDKTHIINRAKALNLTHKIPSKWEEAYTQEHVWKGEATKKPKEDVNYRDSTSATKRCGLCKYYNTAGSCSIVEGVIAPKDVCDDFKAEVKTPGSVLVKEAETNLILESDSGFQRIFEADKEGKEWDVILIQVGTSKNGKYYPASVLKEAAQLFEGVSAFADHATDQEFRQRPERSIRDKVGIFKDVEFGQYKVRGRVVEGLKARFKVMVPWLREVLKESINLEEPNFLGFSVDVIGGVEKKNINGKLVESVKRIVHVNSVDVVTSPSAGGELIRLVASNNNSYINNKGEDVALSIDELSKLIKQETTSAIQEALRANKNDTGVTKEEYAELKETFRRKNDSDRINASINAARGLSEMGRERVKNNLTELATRRSPEDEEIISAIKEATAYEAAFAAKYNIPRTMSFREQVEVGWSEKDKYDLGVRGYFEGHDLPDKGGHLIPRFRSLREGYCRWSGADAWEVNPIEIFRAFRTDYDSAADHKKIRESVNLAQWGSIYADNLYIQLMKAYKEDKDYDRWKMLVSDIQDVPDFQTQHWIRVGGYSDLPTVPEEGTYTAFTSPSDQAVSYAISKRGGLDDVTFEAIVDDRVQAIRRIPGAMGRSAARTLYKFVLNLATTTNPTMSYDSIALYDSGTHKNTNTIPLSPYGLKVAWQAMRAQTAFGETLEILGERNVPKILVCSNTLEYVAKRIINPSDAFVYALNQQANGNGALTAEPDSEQAMDPQAFKGKLEVLVYDQLTSATNWYLIANPTEVPTLVVGFLNGQREPELFVQDQPTVGAVFTADKITYKVRHIYGGVIEDHRSFYQGDT